MVMTRPSSSWDHQTVCMSMPTMPPQFHTGGGGSCGGAGAAGDAMLKKTDTDARVKAGQRRSFRSLFPPSTNGQPHRSMLPLALAALATPLPPTAAGWRVPALVRPSWTTPPRAYRAPLALYTSDACVGHQPSSRTKPHPEQPERLANLLRALQHGQGAVLASPQLGSCASSGRIWRLWAVWHCQGEASPATASGARASRLPEPPISPPLTM